MKNKFPVFTLWCDRKREQGFTLVEMVVVIVITGIIGGIVAIFIRAPVQGYVDSARRAGMTDIADTALRRIGRDLRLALPNSVRVSGTCNGTAACYLEFIPTSGGGRYRVDAPGNILDFTASDSSFDVIGPMPVFAAGDSIVVYNLGIAGASAYDNGTGAANCAASPSCTTYSSNTAATVTIAGKQFPFDSPFHRFQVVQGPVTYACDSASGTLRRYWSYGFWAGQPAPPAGGTSALLATNVSACSFVYDANVVAQRAGLATMRLTITQSGESVALYSATHVSNVP